MIGVSLGVVLWCASAVAASPVGLGLLRTAVSPQAISASSSEVLTGDGELFVEPVGGWASADSPSAQLMDSPGASFDGYDVSLSGPTALPGHTDGLSTDEDVFAEPSGGWAGPMTEAAQLTDSSGDLVQNPSLISSRTAIAIASTTVGIYPAAVVDVWAEPPAGWSGEQTETARLRDSRGWVIDRVDASTGRVIVAEAEESRTNIARSREDVFVEPPGGWSGTIPQSATLELNASPHGRAAAGTPLLTVGDRLFAEPAGGWHGRIAPVAVLLPEYANPHIETVASVDGRQVLVRGAHAGASAPPSCTGGSHACPYPITDWFFNAPAGGWSGTIAALPALRAGPHDAPQYGLLLDGDTQFTTSPAGIYVAHIDTRPRSEHRLSPKTARNQTHHNGRTRSRR